MRLKKITRCVALVSFVLLSAQSLVFGAETPTNDELLKELEELRRIIQKQDTRIKDLERKVSGQQRKIDSHSEAIEIEDHRDVSGRLKGELERLKNIGGLDIGAGITFVGQGTPNANNGDATDGEDSRFDGSWSADIEIAKEFDEYGMAFLHMEAGQGDTLESEISVFSNVNRDSGDTGANVQITEAWYEHYLFNKQFTVTGGKIDASNYIDTNEYANDETSQFLGHMFRNSAVIGWPDDNALGLRAYLAPKFADFLDMELVYMDETGDWENIFDNPFLAAQLNFMPAKVFGYDEEMWAGNYRAFFWYNGAAHPKVKDPDVLKRGSVGFGLSMDQKITDVYGVFGRFGWADPERNDFAYDWSCGAQMTGKYWNREDDVIALAIGQVIPGKDYKDVNDHHKAETHFEAYYAFKVNDHLTLSPDLQIIWNPNGGGTVHGKDKDTIFVYGIRGQIDF